MKRNLNFTSKALIAFLTFTSLLGACKKQDPVVPVIAKNKAKTEAIPPFLFDWESATYMPSLPANVVPMPWQGAVGGIDAGIVGDYKKADGWELVYNSFDNVTSPTINKPGGLYFALYNKYRGLLRFYLYIPPGTATATSQIVHGLSLFGSGNSQMLNFESGSVISAGTNTPGFAKTNNQQINLLGNWVGMDYEIAYDPNTEKTTYPAFGLQWNTKTLNITNLSLNGSQTGAIEGQITTPSNGDVLSILNNVTQAGLTFASASAVNKLAGTASAEGKTFLSGVGTAISNLLSGKIVGFFSGLAGGSSSNSQQVHLKMDTKISLQGTATNSIGISNPFFVLPGQSNSQTASGPNPNYNETMGVFNLLDSPEVVAQYYHRNSTYHYEHPARFKFSFRPENLPMDKLVFNPALLKIANIENKHEELLIINPLVEGGADFTPSFHIDGGTHELAGNDNVYVDPDNVPGRDREAIFYRNFSNHKKEAEPGQWQTAVRISFDIVPKDGSPKVKMVKTFNLRKTFVRMTDTNF